MKVYACQHLASSVLSGPSRTNATKAARVFAKAALAPARIRGTSRLVVFSNELNRWGNRDGGDSDAGQPEHGFDQDTASVVLRLLTVRATQRVLNQLMEFDLLVAQWLNNYVAENPPSEGNKFLLKLLSHPGKAIPNHATAQVHIVDPRGLAHRILEVRTDMANSVMSGFPAFVSLENTSLMRSHLESTSYTCGSSDKTAKGSMYRRGYNRPRSGEGQR